MLASASLRKVAGHVRQLLVATKLDAALAQFTDGASPRSLRARIAPDHMLYRQPTLRRIRRNGIRFELDVSDYMEWCAYFGFATEPRGALYRLIRAGDVALDVGTNVGETLLNLARISGERGRVIGFEVNPRTYQKCRRNVALNAYRNVEVLPVGLGHLTGTLKMHSPTARNTGGDRVLARELSGDGAIDVAVTTLDAFASERRLDRIDLIKIDVEGFEMNVLRGAVTTLQKLHPTLFIELDDRNLRDQGSLASEVVAFVSGLGYGVRSAQTGAPVRASDDFTACHFDIVCTYGN